MLFFSFPCESHLSWTTVLKWEITWPCICPACISPQSELHSLLPRAKQIDSLSGEISFASHWLGKATSCLPVSEHGDVCWARPGTPAGCNHLSVTPGEAPGARISEEHCRDDTQSEMWDSLSVLHTRVPERTLHKWTLHIHWYKSPQLYAGKLGCVGANWNVCQSLYCFKICIDYMLFTVAFKFKYGLNGVWWGFLQALLL